MAKGEGSAVLVSGLSQSTLREFEQRLLSQRNTAANVESWEQYAKDMLPGGVNRGHPLVQQGFEAGFDAAMNRIRRLLAELQSEAIRQDRERRLAQERSGNDEPERAAGTRTEGR